DPHVVLGRPGGVGKAQAVQVHAVAVLRVVGHGLAVHLVGHGAQLGVAVAVFDGDGTLGDAAAHQGHAPQLGAGGADLDAVAVGNAQLGRVVLVQADGVVRVHLAQAAGGDGHA